MRNKAEENREPGLPDEPDLEPERTVDELERRTAAENMPAKEEHVREADAEDDEEGAPIHQQDVEPDERRTPEPPS